MSYCRYYQAQVVKKETLYLTAILRSFEHCVFDRTVDKETGTFEFFVPELMAEPFEEIMNYFQQAGIITGFAEMPNRLLDPTQTV